MTAKERNRLRAILHDCFDLLIGDKDVTCIPSDAGNIAKQFKALGKAKRTFFLFLSLHDNNEYYQEDEAAMIRAYNECRDMINDLGRNQGHKPIGLK